MDEIAHSVNDLYERYPYPSLPIQNEHDLTRKLHANIMGKILTTAGLEPSSLSGKNILDAGCGTGEKSCYFSYYGARVTAIDLCEASLQKGKTLAEKFNLPVEFIHGDIARFATAKTFDHIFCLGVLHHTSDPYRCFQGLADLCRPGGTITLGLYNRYGRLFHRARRMWIRINAGDDIDRRLAYVEKNIYRRPFRSAHELAYAADKYVNPHEGHHTVGEVLGWFERNGIEYMSAHPHVENGNRALFTQMKWLMERKGFFIMSGRKH